MTDVLEKRLKRLEDILEIQQLFIDYGQYLDAGRFEDYAALFAEEGEAQLGPLGRAKGRAAIRSLMEQNLGASVGTTYHIITSPMIKLAGEKAESEVMWTVILRNQKGLPELGMVGRHRDQLVRENGRWRFLLRRGFVDIPSKMPG